MCLPRITFRGRESLLDDRTLGPDDAMRAISAVSAGSAISM
jgi:hypothetical protein